jgi:uncharacterized membrane protein
MASKYQVVLARFEDVDTASDALRALAKSIKLADWAVVLNEGGGDIAFREGKDAGGGRGFALGALATAAAAVLLGPVGWTGLAVGGAAGGLAAKLHDANIPSEQLKQLGERLEPGNAAVIAVVEGPDATGVSASLKASGGEVVAMGVSEDLKASLEGLAPSGVEVQKD